MWSSSLKSLALTSFVVPLQTSLGHTFLIAYSRDFLGQQKCRDNRSLPSHYNWVTDTSHSSSLLFVVLFFFLMCFFCFICFVFFFVMTTDLKMFVRKVGLSFLRWKQLIINLCTVFAIVGHCTRCCIYMKLFSWTAYNEMSVKKLQLDAQDRQTGRH